MATIDTEACFEFEKVIYQVVEAEAPIAFCTVTMTAQVVEHDAMIPRQLWCDGEVIDGEAREQAMYHDYRVFPAGIEINHMRVIAPNDPVGHYAPFTMKSTTSPTVKRNKEGKGRFDIQRTKSR